MTNIIEGGGQTIVFMGTGHGSGGNNAKRFQTIFGTGGLGTLANQATILTRQLLITRYQCASFVNTKDGDTIVGLDDDGTTATSLTIGAGLLGLFDSGAINIIVVAGSLVAMFKDLTASTLGSWGGNQFMEGIV